MMLSYVWTSLQENFVGIGRICCDADDKLNHTSVLLEGARGHPSFGASVPLKLSSVPSYALFPGQIVAVEGTNPTGGSLVAQRIFTDAPLPMPSEPLKLTPGDGQSSFSVTQISPIQAKVVVAY